VQAPAQATGQATTTVLLLGTANDGVYRSSDGGVTWQPASAGLPAGGVWQLEPDPNHLSTAYLTTGSVFRTTDAGATWQPVTGFPSDGPGITALAFNGATLLAASIHGLVASTGRLPATQFPPVPGGAPRQIVPVDQDLIYALGANGILYAHGDASWLRGGAFWQPLQGGLPGEPLTAFTYVAATAGSQSMCPLNTCVVLFAGVEGHGLWKSLDSGQTWHQETDHLALPLTATIRAVLSTNLSTAYAAVAGMGLFHSVHSGQFWYPAPHDPRDTYTALAQDGSTIVAATLGHGVQLFSVHGGLLTWQRQASGLPANVEGISLVPLAVPAPAPTRVAHLPGACGRRNGVPLCGPFRRYYNAAHPPVVIFGNPLGPATYDRRDPTLIVQWFERARFEYRPDLPGQVRLTPLGVLLLGKRTFPKQAPAPGARYFPQTGFSLSGRFLTFWQRHGGAAVLGYPISPVLHEANGDGTNQEYTLQYLQYARLELHPELAGTSYSVELGLLGRQYLCQYYGQFCQD
jgi:photosystem II stability/assembly factor-like uncharacterized protein